VRAPDDRNPFAREEFVTLPDVKLSGRYLRKR